MHLQLPALQFIVLFNLYMRYLPGCFEAFPFFALYIIDMFIASVRKPCIIIAFFQKSDTHPYGILDVPKGCPALNYILYIAVCRVEVHVRDVLEIGIAPHAFGYEGGCSDPGGVISPPSPRLRKESSRLRVYLSFHNDSGLNLIRTYLSLQPRLQPGPEHKYGLSHILNP